MADNYELLELIGSGAMGEVRRAVQVSLRREVAVKLLPRSDHLEAELVQRFHREARLLASLSHPNVVRLFDSGEMDGRLFFAMELLEGSTLAELIADTGGMSLAEAAPLIVQLADALAFLHRHGVCHRDIKPGNVMVTADGRVKLVDFGLGRAVSSTVLTVEGTGLGTPRYMAPEAFQGGDSSFAQDIYGMACVAHELITGQPCFSPGDFGALVRTKLAGPPPDPRTVDPALPGWLSQLQVRALGREPAERPSADEYRDAMAAATRAKPARTKPANASSVASLARGAPLPAEREQTDHGSRRLLRAVALAACALVPISFALRAGRAPRAADPARVIEVGAPAVPAGSPQAPGSIAVPAAPAAAEWGLRDLRLFETDRSVLVDADLLDESGATLEVGRWADRATIRRCPVPPGQGFVHQLVNGLEPVSDCFLRIRFADGRPGLADYRFHTWPESASRERFVVMQHIEEDSLLGVAAANDLLNFPDPRIVPLLRDLLRRAVPGRLDKLRKISSLTASLRSPELAEGLIRFARAGELRERCDVVRAISLGRNPAGAALARELVPRAIGVVERQGLADALARRGGPAACDEVAQLVTGEHSDWHAARQMLFASTARAREHYLAWLARRDFGEWNWLGMQGLAGLADPRDVGVLAAAAGRTRDLTAIHAGIEGLVTIGDGDAARALAALLAGSFEGKQMESEAQADLVRGLARIGTAAEVPALERVSKRGGALGREAELAIAAIVGARTSSSVPLRVTLAADARWARTGLAMRAGESFDVSLAEGPVEGAVHAWQGGRLHALGRQPVRLLATRRGELFVGTGARLEAPAVVWIAP